MEGFLRVGGGCQPSPVVLGDVQWSACSQATGGRGGCLAARVPSAPSPHGLPGVSGAGVASPRSSGSQPDALGRAAAGDLFSPRCRLVERRGCGLSAGPLLLQPPVWVTGGGNVRNGRGETHRSCSVREPSARKLCMLSVGAWLAAADAA